MRWSVTIRSADPAPWVVALEGPITSADTSELMAMTDWIFLECSAGSVVFDLWAAGVDLAEGGAGALAAMVERFLLHHTWVRFRGGPDGIEPELTRLVGPTACSFER